VYISDVHLKKVFMAQLHKPRPPKYTPSSNIICDYDMADNASQNYNF